MNASAVTGFSLLGLVLLSMAWLFFVLGAVANCQVLLRGLRAKPGERIPSGIPFIPGIVGSLAAFFTVPALARHGVAPPWPWLWILLPLALDLYSVFYVFALLAGLVRQALGRGDGPR